jgi:hypothetical protein
VSAVTDIRQLIGVGQPSIDVNGPEMQKAIFIPLPTLCNLADPEFLFVLETRWPRLGDIKRTLHCDAGLGQ